MSYVADLFDSVRLDGAFDSIQTTFEYILLFLTFTEQDEKGLAGGKAAGLLKSLRSFDFVLLNLLNDFFKVTSVLCDALHHAEMDIMRATHLTKACIQTLSGLLTDDNAFNLLSRVTEICKSNGIHTENLSPREKETRQNKKKRLLLKFQFKN